MQAWINFHDGTAPEGLIAPLSTPQGRDYLGALPAPTPELDHAKRYVGFSTNYMIYACVWNDRQPEKSGWHFQGHVW